MAGESVLSWVHRAAASWCVGRWVATRMLGLLTDRDRDWRYGSRALRAPQASSYLPLNSNLSDEVVDRVQAATGLLAEELRAMTLARYLGVAIGLNGLARRGLGTFPPQWLRFEWVHLTSVGICPQCVADGSWRISWHLPWSFLCPVHRCYLMGACPACGHRFEPHRAGAFGFCAGFPRRQRGRSCRAELAGLLAPAVEDVELLRLQERLLRLADEPTDRRAALQVFRDLRLMVLFALIVAAPEHLDGADPVVRRRFEEFCVAHDDAAGGGRKVNGHDENWFRDRLLMAAALRIASRIVFGDDPYVAASGVTPLEPGPDRLPGVNGSPPRCRGRRSTCRRRWPVHGCHRC